MKILLAPSETKNKGGTKTLNPGELLFGNEIKDRKELLTKYNEIIKKADLKQLSKMFGLKKEADINESKTDIFASQTLKAIQRYSGVAFDYLSYEDLKKEEKEYIDNNVILFSNLFGPIRASDKIPEYKLKQGESVEGDKPEKIYKNSTQQLLDKMFEKEEILDLRAGFYDKFYTPSKEYTTLKFLKEGKVVSHWAKAYRGMVLKHMAQNNIKSIKDLLNSKVPGLTFKEKTTVKNKTEIIYTIDQ